MQVVYEMSENTIVAIGGGKIETGGTLSIDREIVDEVEGNAEALFIPTASENPEDFIQAENYRKRFEKIYKEKLGCQTNCLKLVNEDPSEKEIKEKIKSADLIYVGGGNTKRIMNIWRDKNVDSLLKQAYKSGKVLSGLSAGAICWFEHGHSDSESYVSEDEEWDFIKVNGLNIIEDFIYCPHYHKEDREESFQKMMEENPEKTGIAVDNDAAVKIKDAKLKVLTSSPKGKAYIISEGKERKQLEEDTEYKLKELKEI